MKIKTYLCGGYEFLKRKFFFISWISLVLFLLCNTFIYYKDEQQFFYVRRILGLGLCVSRATASVLNLCSALLLVPFCKKLNQFLYRIISKLWPTLFFYWLEKAKSFHMTVAITLSIFAVVHSASHFVNFWNFSRGYDEEWTEINFASYKDENPLWLLLSVAGITGVSMLLIVLGMSATSTRVVRRNMYNVFWYTHQLYLMFMVLLIVHPLSGVLKEEVVNSEASLYSSHIDPWSNNVTSEAIPKFAPIQSKTWCWIAVPLTCYLVDILWRILTRNRAKIEILEVAHMAGRVISLKLSCPDLEFKCRAGQYVLLQCLDSSLIEWHPFTVVKVPTENQRYFIVWIRVKGDWTDALEKLLLYTRPNTLNILVDGPFSSPMEGVSWCEVAICVAAGVGITPFVPVLHHMLQNPRSRFPGRVHLIWIVRSENELAWLADLANKTILQLRTANRPDRLHLELYVTKDNVQTKAHTVSIDEKGSLTHVVRDNVTDDEKTTLLTPNKRSPYTKAESRNSCDVIKEYPVLGCRVLRGRPYWDRVFGFWVHFYPE
ncbi:NADPH oxidase 4 isoform X2 [Bombyx mori]|nr:NADPH oxidase 4 isoform X2 [Bombyx mori]